MINFSGNTCLYWMKAATAGMHAQQRIGEKWRETDNKNYIAFTLMNMMIMCQSNNNFVKQWIRATTTAAAAREKTTHWSVQHV